MWEFKNPDLHRIDLKHLHPHFQAPCDEQYDSVIDHGIYYQIENGLY